MFCMCTIGVVHKVTDSLREPGAGSGLAGCLCAQLPFFLSASSLLLTAEKNLVAL